MGATSLSKPARSPVRAGGLAFGAALAISFGCTSGPDGADLPLRVIPQEGALTDGIEDGSGVPPDSVNLPPEAPPLPGPVPPPTTVPPDSERYRTPPVPPGPPRTPPPPDTLGVPPGVPWVPPDPEPSDPDPVPPDTLG